MNHKNDRYCFLCGNEMESETTPYGTHHSKFTCKTCGEYILDRHIFLLSSNGPIIADQLKAIMSGITKYYNTYLKNEKVISLEYIQKFEKEGDIKVIIPYTIDDKLNYILKYFKYKSEYPSSRIDVNFVYDYPIGFAKNLNEYGYYINHLVGIGYIKEVGFVNENHHIYSLTVNGWKYLTELEKANQNTNTCFIAMCFANKYDQLYNDAIKPAILRAKYKPIRLKEENQNSPQSDMKIDDRIIAEIRKARFVVADYSMQKQNVYYEAGYARGLGTKVINCCNKKEIDKDKLHFDTRNYPYLPWQEGELEDFQNRLYNHICAEIGEGTFVSDED